MADPSISPNDIPPIGGAILGLSALGVWLWDRVFKGKADLGTSKLIDDMGRDRSDLRSRVQELEKDNKELSSKLVEMSATNGGLGQLQQRLNQLELEFKESQLELDNAEMTIEILTIHMVRMSFYMESLKGSLPENPHLTDLKIDLPEVLAEIQARKKKHT